MQCYGCNFISHNRTVRPESSTSALVRRVIRFHCCWCERCSERVDYRGGEPNKTLEDRLPRKAAGNNVVPQRWLASYRCREKISPTFKLDLFRDWSNEAHDGSKNRGLQQAWLEDANLEKN